MDELVWRGRLRLRSSNCPSMIGTSEKGHIDFPVQASSARNKVARSAVLDDAPPLHAAADA